MAKDNKITIKPVFVRTKNVRNFEATMDGLALSAGEGRLAMIWSEAGFGKSRTAQVYAANNSCVYLRTVTIWSEMDFLQGLCRECGVISPPGRKGQCFTQIVDRLSGSTLPVFVDELEKMSRRYLDLIRDISDITYVPFVLIGEAELVASMQRNKRVWSRTYQQMQFDPISVADIILYAAESTGISIPMDVGKLLYSESSGDFRVVKRDLIKIVQYANANSTRQVTLELARMAIKAGLSGR